MSLPTATSRAAFADARILVFGGERSELEAIEHLLGQWDYRNVVGTTDASKLPALCTELCPDLILLDLDACELDGMATLEGLTAITCREAYLPMIVLGAELGDEARSEALALGAKDFLTKPIHAIDAGLRVGNLLETRRLYREVSAHTRVLEERIELRTRELELVRLEFVQRLALAAEYRDEEGAEHVQRVGRSAALLARELGLPEADVRLIRSVAPLHDIGNIGIPDSLLLRAGELSDDEFELIKGHTMIGSKILSGGRSRHLRMAEEIARSHHERWDGSGYPDGLAGRSIPLPARLTAVADVFDALTRRRPHKEAWPLEQSVAEIGRQAGSHLDPDAVSAFGSLDHEALLAPVGPLVSDVAA